MSDPILEGMARMAAQRMVTEYAPQAYSYGLNKEQLKWLIRRVAEIAVETLSK